MVRSRFGFWGLVGALAIGACGDDGETDKDTSSTSTNDDGADGETVEPDPWAVPTENNQFRIVYGNRGRLPENQDENELWLMDNDGENEQALTALAKLEELDPPLSCNFGCIVSPDLEWIVVVEGAPTSEGFTLRLGQFKVDGTVSLLKGDALTGIVDFEFAGDRMFYSQKDACVGPSCTYKMSVVKLEENVNIEIPFLTFPPQNELEGSTYKGHFKVSQDGKNLVMLNTTIRSVAVYLWREGTGLVELDFICKSGDKDNCEGTGSEYADTDPVAIDQQSRYVAFFTYADRFQRIHLYDTENPALIKSSIVAQVPSGAYISNVCEPGTLADWQWQRVVGDPWFTPDGQEIVFLGINACPEGGTTPTKVQTNIFRVKVSTIQSEKTLTEDDVFNVTNHPKGDVTANRRPDAFGLSPDGATAVFVGTPSFDQNGNAIADGNPRQRNDREIYRIRLDGSNAQQLTNDIEFSAEAPAVLSMP